jgi:PAS domain S-box-containing protein
MEKTKILVVEDEAIVAMDIENRVSLLGYDIVGIAAKGEDAIALSRTFRPELILMDIRLQGDMDGISAADIIRKEYRIPIVFLTAFAEDNTLERAKSVEPYGYLLKPFEDRELKVMIEMAVAKHKADLEVLRLSRMYALLSQINQTIVRVRTREELFESICEQTVRFGEFGLAWIGLLDHETRCLVPVARSGDTPVNPETMGLDLAYSGQGWHPTCSAAVEGITVIADETKTNNRYEYRGPDALFGFRSAGATPINLKGKLFGILSVFTSEPDFFSEKEVNLLEEIGRDISFALDAIAAAEERDGIEQALQVSEERFRQIFENSSIGLAVYRLPEDLNDFVILEFNPAAERITRFRRMEVLNKPLTELFPDMVRFGLFDVLQRVQRTGVSERIPMSLYEDARLSIWIEIYVFKLSTGELVTIFDDVTERKTALDALRASERLYRSLVEVSPDGIALFDLSGKITFVSPKLAEMYGLDSVDDAIGSTIFDWIAPESLEQAKTNIENLLSHTRSSGHEYSLVKKDGTRFIGEINGAYLTADDGLTPRAIVTVHKDITERTRIEEQLRKLSRAVEQSPASKVITDLQGAIEYVNPKFTEVSGYTLEEVRGKNSSILKSGETSNEEYKILWDTILAGNEWSGIFHNKKKNGSLFWESAHIAPIKNAKGEITHFLAVKEDITLRKQAEESLRVSHESLRHLVNKLESIREEERASISREVHDELGQILTALKIDALSIEKTGKEYPSILPKVNPMISAIDIGIQAVQNLTARLRPGILDNLGLISAIEWQTEDWRKRMGIECKLTIPKQDYDIPEDISTALFRILQESLTNVARHAQAKKVSVVFSITSKEYLLRIEDNGIGISEDKINAPGSLGLLGMRERLRLFDGKMSVNRLAEGGTRIEVTIPGKNKKKAERKSK